MLSIIIVNYLQKDFLKKCVASIHKNLARDSFEVIVVNNSQQEDLSEIPGKFTSVKIVPNENTGFSKANNLGVKNASGEYLLFLNADTEIPADFTNDLLNHFKNKNYGAIGLRLRFADGSFQNSFGLFPTILNEYKNRKLEIAFRNKNAEVISKREKEYSEIKEVDWVTGAALFIRKDVFEKLLGFDERFFMYYEDIDLCLRLSRAGYKNYYYPFTKIIHHKGEYTRDGFKKESVKIQAKSQLLYYKLHNSFMQLLLLKVIKMFI
jgi:N-acetylglucosaminyl-diphospho-decaprenol L-rhamnosyltransferase